MAQPTLDERVTALEQKVAELASQQNPAPRRKKDWRSTVGMFADDPIMDEIIEEGRKIREQDREQARQ
jgi:hypothetical protein